MFFKYEIMPNTSRIWIYQSDRKFTETELELIQKYIEQFLSEWKRHGEDLKASYRIIYQQFIVLLVDESVVPVSGCAIDSSVGIIKNIENNFSVNLTNKLLISYKEENTIKITPLATFKKMIVSEKINENTIVFNNLVATKHELETQWEVPLKNSWHQQFLLKK